VAAAGCEEFGDAGGCQRGRSFQMATRDLGSDFFLTVVDRRPAYCLELMDLNVSFLYSDVDIVSAKGPYPFFTGDYDLWVPGRRRRRGYHALHQP